jgi:hypothetical protein
MKIIFVLCVVLWWFSKLKNLFVVCVEMHTKNFWMILVFSGLRKWWVWS